MFLDVLVQNLHGALSRYDVAKEYLCSRLVTEEEIQEFRIGYSKVVSASDDGSEDFEFFLKETHKGRSFEQKIIFPLYDVIGRATGLFGRSIDTKEFKFYLNREGKYTGTLVGLYQALPYIYASGRVYVVEGPFDMLAFRKVYKNTVGALTAGLSEAQHELLSFFAKEIVTVFDSDKPGKDASEQAQRRWKNVIPLDLGYKDPDKCLKEKGSVDRFAKFVQEKVSRKFFLQ
jgi:DNA primase